MLCSEDSLPSTPAIYTVMSNQIDMNQLSSSAFSKELEQDDTDNQLHNIAQIEAKISVWAWTSATLFFLLSSCLILSPRLLLFVSEFANSTEGRTTSTLSPLESFLALQFGIFLLAFSVALVLNIPSTSPMNVVPNDHLRVPDHPLVTPAGLACALTAFVSYNSTEVGPLAFMFFLPSSLIAIWSFWIIMFAGSSPVSKKTGADKHTSSFIFGNKASASFQKKQWKKEQKAKK